MYTATAADSRFYLAGEAVHSIHPTVISVATTTPHTLLLLARASRPHSPPLLITANAVFNLDGTHATVPPAPGAGTVQRQVEAAIPAVLVPAVRRAARAYAAVGVQTAFVQSFAALEVLHVLLGLVRSPLVTTLIQVGSRLYLVWGITYLFPKVRLVY